MRSVVTIASRSSTPLLQLLRTLLLPSAPRYVASLDFAGQCV
jgi:hypothetical protein